MSEFWRIDCLRCHSQYDLLKDGYGRIICRECLKVCEFTEVESELYARDVSSRGKASAGREESLPGSKTIRVSKRDSRNEELNEMDGEE